MFILRNGVVGLCAIASHRICATFCLLILEEGKQKAVAFINIVVLILTDTGHSICSGALAYFSSESKPFHPTLMTSQLLYNSCLTLIPTLKIAI